MQRCFRKQIFEYLHRAGYLGNTILRTLLSRVDRTNIDITIGIRNEATANKFRKDNVKVRILDLNDSSALEQAAEESDGQLTSLKRWIHVPYPCIFSGFPGCRFRPRCVN